MLTPQRIQREKRVTGAYTPDQWLACLRPLAQTDRRGDSARKWLIGAAIVAGIAGFVGGIIAESILVGGVGLLVAVACVVGFAVLKRQDLPNNLRGFLVPFISLLREEMAPDEPLHLSVDLRGGTIKAKQRDQRRSSGGYPSVVETFYEDPWLAGETRLVDGTRLGWQVSNAIRQRTITRRNPRGKLKTKTKYKVKTMLDVRVGLPREDYAALAPVAAALGDGDQLALKPGAKRDVFRVRRVVVARSADPVLEVRHMLDLIASAYHQVAPVRAGGTRQ